MMKLIKSRFFVIITFILILLLGLLLRSKDYLLGDFNFFLDQSRDLLLTKQIVIDHDITLIGGRSGISGIFHGPLWLYIIAPFFLIAKGDPYLTLVPLFVIMGVLQIGIAFVLTSKLYDVKTGLYASLFIAISHALIASSANISNAYMMPLIFMLFLYASLQLLRGKKNYFIAMCFLFGLGFHFESAFAVFFIPLTAFLFILKRQKIPLKTIIIGLASFVLATASFILFEIRNKFLMTHAALQLLKGGMKPMAGYKEYADIGFRIQDRAMHFLNYFNMSVFEKNIPSLLVSAGIVLVGIGLFIYALKFKKKSQSKTSHELNKEFIFIGGIPVLYFVIYVLYPFPLWDHYMLPLVVSSTLFLALCIREISKRIHPLIIFLLVLIMMAPSLFWTWDHYLGIYKGDRLFGNYRDQVEIAEYVFKDAKQKKFGYMVYDPGQLTYNMDYLMWYLDTKYHVGMVNGKIEPMYLILSPEPKWDPLGQESWKKNVVRTNGNVLSRKILKQNIAVERIDTSKDTETADPNYFQNLIFR